MKKNILIVLGLLGLSFIFYVMFNDLKANAQVKNNSSANSSNSNKTGRGNLGVASNRVGNGYAGNAFISNTGAFIDHPKASGTEITEINGTGVTFIFPKGFEIYDVSKMYDYEAGDDKRLFDTKAHLHSLDGDWGIDLVISTSRNQTFEESIINSRTLIGGGGKFTVLKSGLKSNINGLEVVSSSGKQGQQVWTMDAFKIPNGALIVSAIGFPEEMKKSQPKIKMLLQSIKQK